MKKSESTFVKKVWEFYKMNKRPMPWRIDTSPYSIFISEVMLQQTQVARVLIKYPLFLQTFPNFKSLAHADTQTLLSVWQGMGYNRRALYLRAAALIIEEKYNGTLPKDTALLDELPGIGYATACSIVVFAFNIPVSFIETNIRRVHIHHFFPEKDKIDDKDIFKLVLETVDKNNPREWYWALMDYGAYLAKQGENPNKRSIHYNKQKKFIGSVREIRGGILRLLLKHAYSQKDLGEIYTDERLFTALGQLLKEGFIIKKKDQFKIL
jgi:A/G-specific adenine glycosylase